MEHTVAILLATFALNVPSLTKDAVVALRSSPRSPAAATAAVLPPGPVGNLKATAWTADPSRLQEDLRHSDAVTAIVTKPTPPATEAVNGIDPNTALGVQTFSWLGNHSLSDAMAAINKTAAETGILTVTGGQPFPPSSFDWSSVISAPSTEQMKEVKELMDASGVDSSQGRVVQTAGLQAPSWTLSGISNPSVLPSNTSIIGGLPAVLPTAWQTPPAVTGTAFPATNPTTLPTSLQ